MNAITITILIHSEINLRVNYTCRSLSRIELMNYFIFFLYFVKWLLYLRLLHKIQHFQSHFWTDLFNLTQIMDIKTINPKSLNLEQADDHCH